MSKNHRFENPNSKKISTMSNSLRNFPLLNDRPRYATLSEALSAFHTWDLTYDLASRDCSSLDTAVDNHRANLINMVNQRYMDVESATERVNQLDQRFSVVVAECAVAKAQRDHALDVVTSFSRHAGAAAREAMERSRARRRSGMGEGSGRRRR